MISTSLIATIGVFILALIASLAVLWIVGIPLAVGTTLFAWLLHTSFTPIDKHRVLRLSHLFGYALIWPITIFRYLKSA